MALLLAFARPARAASITVFAAASLTDCMKEIANTYEKQSGDKVRFNFAGSSFLARQIEEGAPADIFFSADELWMDRLQQKELIDRATRVSRLSNTLVIVVHADSQLKIASPADLAGDQIQRIALADPKAVPAGIYARKFLEKENLWKRVAPRVIPTDNVRAALAAVESGNVEAGIVYRTDAAISSRVKVAYPIPAANGPDISYPVALVKESKNREAAKRLLDFLGTDAASRIFEKNGFLVRK